jgi:NAD(P)-dependent dehydrogenase (short-subunit alcohol dehydrogenase family)
MIENGGGRIINVSSSVATDLHRGMSPYAASKAGLETLTKYMAAELAPHGIAANVYRIDSAVATEGARVVGDDSISDWASVEDTAKVALWVASQPISYTGQTAVMSELCRDLGLA